eukprot:COSAG06_NODE_46214_length_348_cov_1.253012_1_plen_59_part_10
MKRRDRKSRQAGSDGDDGAPRAAHTDTQLETGCATVKRTTRHVREVRLLDHPDAGEHVH